MVRSGELLFGGDWAIAHGDAEALAHVAKQLAEQVPHEDVELRRIAALCATSFSDAVASWARMRRRLGKIVAAARRGELTDRAQRGTTSESNSVPSASIACSTSSSRPASMYTK
jgi:glycosyltransferase A (GT-A) superfamily protein (DUF2064 family)